MTSLPHLAGQSPRRDAIAEVSARPDAAGTEPLPMRITVGQGATNPHGATQPVPARGGRIAGLADALRALPAIREGWWSPACFGPSLSCGVPSHAPQCAAGAGSHRKTDTWIATCAIGVDVDSLGHADVKEADRQRLDAWLRCGDHGASIVHHTPHGARLLFVPHAEVTDRELARRAHDGARLRVLESLRRATLFDVFEIDDGASRDISRWWWSPRAIVKGVQREAEILITRPEPVSMDWLLGAADSESLGLDVRSGHIAGQATSGPNAHTRPTCATVADAVARFRADNPQCWPASSGQCPACGHKGCFGAHPKSPTRWMCFSANHAKDSGRCGRESRHGAWTGDYLDLVAKDVGATRRQILIQEGYLRRDAAQEDAARVTPSSVGGGRTLDEGAGANMADHPTESMTAEGQPWHGYFEMTDRGNALRLAWHLRDRVRWAGEGLGWLVWDDTHWARGDLVESRVRESVARTMRALAASAIEVTDAWGQVNVPDWQQKCSRFLARCSSHSARNCALKDLRDVDVVRTDPATMDADPYLLTCRSGTIDLRTGALLPHNPAHRITSCVEAHHDPDAKAPRWMRFLDEVTGGDAEFVAFVHRAVGFVLVGEGSVRTKALLYFYGPPNSGKGTIIYVLERLLGPTLCGGLSWGALSAATTGGPNSELAQLEGKRLASIADTGGSPRWDAETLKKLTGGDHITCSEKNKPARSFQPRAALIIAGNDRPTISGAGSQAIRDRIRSVPFRVSFSDDPRDVQLGRAQPAEPGLKDFLISRERDGIFRWLIEGARKYIAEGLGSCAVVDAERNRWSDDDRTWLEDFLEQFVVTANDPDPPGDIHAQHVTAADLLHGLRIWMSSEGAGQREIETLAPNTRSLSRDFNRLCSTATRFRHVTRDQKATVLSAESGRRKAWGHLAWRPAGLELLGRPQLRREGL